MLTSSEEQISVEKFLNYIRERRVLSSPAEKLTRQDARVSVQKIVVKCASNLSNFEEGSAIAAAINTISGACSYFLTLDYSSQADFYVAVGALRALVAEPIAILSAIYARDPGSIFFAAIHPRDIRE